MLAALALRVKGIGVTNLWYDEGNSWYVAHLPWGALLENIRASPVGPLYFSFLKLWMGVFGDSEAALRAPSLVASLLVIPATYAVGARAFTRGAAAVGVCLLTISPLHLYFAQEARMYMPLALLTTLGMLCYLRWRDATFAPRTGGIADGPTRWGAPSGAASWRALACYTTLGTAMVHTNVVSVAFIAALDVDALWLVLRRRRGAIAWLAANAVIAITLLLYARGVRLAVAGATQGWRGSPGLAASLRALVEYPLVALHGVYYYPHDFAAAAVTFQENGGGSAFRELAELFVVQPLALIVVVLALGAGFARFFSGPRRPVALAVVVPLAVGAAISTSRQVDLARYFLFVSPFLYLLLGSGLTRLSESSIVSGALAIAVLTLASAFGIRAYQRIDSRDSDYRPVAGAIERSRARARVVYVLPDQAAEPLQYYLRDYRDVHVRPARSASSVARSLFEHPNAPAWLVLDYRSPSYDEPPAGLSRSFGARLLGDRYYAAGGGGVRLSLLERSRAWRGSSDVERSAAVRR